MTARPKLTERGVSYEARSLSKQLIALDEDATIEDAKHVVASLHGFSDWDGLITHIRHAEALRDQEDSLTLNTKRRVEQLIDDVTKLQALVYRYNANPSEQTPPVAEINGIKIVIKRVYTSFTHSNILFMEGVMLSDKNHQRPVTCIVELSTAMISLRDEKVSVLALELMQNGDEIYKSKDTYYGDGTIKSTAITVESFLRFLKELAYCEYNGALRLIDVRNRREDVEQKLYLNATTKETLERGGGKCHQLTVSQRPQSILNIIDALTMDSTLSDPFSSVNRPETERTGLTIDNYDEHVLLTMLLHLPRDGEVFQEGIKRACAVDADSNIILSTVNI